MKSLLARLLPVFLLTPTFAEEKPAVEPGRGVSNFLAKIARDKKAHVAFFGGSITQNAGGHSNRVPDWLRTQFPGVEFTVTNAGLGSTCSLAGAFRFQEDVLAAGPVDLLIVEFAVNDDQDAMHDARTATRGLEGILRQYLTARPDGDAISVQFVNPGILAKHEAGEEAVSVAAHKAVARHYGIASVDVGLALAREIAAGRKTWEKDYHETHPNPAGYEFATGLITQVIAGSIAADPIRPMELPAPFDPGSYDRPTRVDPQALSWLGGWKLAPVSKDFIPKGAIRGDYTKFQALRTDEAGDYLYHTFAGSALSAFVLAGPDAGILEVSVDGGEWKAVDLYHRFSKGLNYPRSVMLAEDLSGNYHTVAIRTSEQKNPASEGHAATVLYFGVEE
jgi:lysophospholipase L1-like esterase